METKFKNKYIEHKQTFGLLVLVNAQMIGSLTLLVKFECFKPESGMSMALKSLRFDKKCPYLFSEDFLLIWNMPMSDFFNIFFGGELTLELSDSCSHAFGTLQKRKK